jgi:hypothetical protein
MLINDAFTHGVQLDAASATAPAFLLKHQHD